MAIRDGSSDGISTPHDKSRGCPPYTVSPVTLNLVVVRSPDIERAAAFYSRLGLRFVRHRHGSGPEHLSAELGGSVFELYPEVANEPATSGTRVGFSVPSLDSAIAALSEHPGVIISPPKDSPWGRRAVVADPDGHRVELLQQSTACHPSSHCLSTRDWD